RRVLFRSRHILQIAWVLSNFPSFFVNPKCCRTLDSLQVLGTSNRHGNTLPDTPPTRARLGRETSRETATDSSGDESTLQKQLGRRNLNIKLLVTNHWSHFYILKGVRLHTILYKYNGLYRCKNVRNDASRFIPHCIRCTLFLIRPIPSQVFMPGNQTQPVTFHTPS